MPFTVPSRVEQVSEFAGTGWGDACNKVASLARKIR